jgi:hypothetical protein
MRKKLGRPKKQQSEKGTYTLSVRLTTEQREMLEKAAKTKGFNPSAYARAIIIQALTQQGGPLLNFCEIDKQPTAHFL